VAALTDSGGNGDAIAGDGIYAARIRIVASNEGVLKYRVRFRGLSTPTTITAIRARISDLPDGPAATDQARIVTDAAGVRSIVDRLLVTFTEGAPESEIQSLLDAIGGIPVASLMELSTLDVQFPVTVPGELDQIIGVLQSSSLVVGASRIYRRQLSGINDDVRLLQMGKPKKVWGFEQTRALEAWDRIEKAGVVLSPVTIAILDTGVRRSHSEFTSRLLGSVSGVYRYHSFYSLHVPYVTFEETSADVDDENGHGTSVAGIVGALNNGKGINGIVAGVAAPYNLLSVKVCDNAGDCQDNEVLWGMAYAASTASNTGVKVMNLSFGLCGTDANVQQLYERAAAYVQKHGILMVASAGNADEDTAIHYPSVANGVIGVGASAQDEMPSVFNRGTSLERCDGTRASPPATNYGPVVDVFAPGGGAGSDDSRTQLGDVFTTDKNGGYQYFSGTSAAAPFVSGAGALLFAVDPKLEVSEVVTRLSNGREKVVDDGRKYGTIRLLDIANALEGMLPATVTWVNPPPSCVVSGQSLADVSWQVDAGAPITWTNLWWSQELERLTNCTPTTELCPLPEPFCCVEDSSCPQCAGGCAPGVFTADTTCTEVACSPGALTTCSAPSVSVPTTYYFTAYAQTSVPGEVGWALPVTVVVNSPGMGCGRFVDNGDGTITDTQTGLQWEKKTGAVGTYVDCSIAPCPDPHDVNNRYQWCLNANHDEYCDNPGYPPDGGAFKQFLTALNTLPCFAGHCDWRLPTVGQDGGTAELESILLSHYPCWTTPCIDPIFGATAPSGYWSSTTTALIPYAADSIDFGFGYDYGDVGAITKNIGLSVRAVRGGSTPAGRYLDNGDGTVTDTQTGLQWEKKTTTVGSGENYTDPHDVDNRYTWTDTSDGDETNPDGTAFTDFLVKLNTPPCFAGHCDWRLPKSGGRPDLGKPSGEPAELESIVLAPYPCGTNPCIDPIFGPTVAGWSVPAGYWSATTFAPNPVGTWGVDFFDGHVGYLTDKRDRTYVRAVRTGS
jgi:subtilisin family serine protease